MISAVDIWTFVHILLFVYWMGADLGVFVAAPAAKRSTLTYPQRSIALQLAVKVDIAPRLSFAPMAPAFAQPAVSGSTPEPERAITGAADEAVHRVPALYALVVVIAFQGTARPF